MARPFKELISLENARERMFEVIKPVTETENIAISDAQHRIIAQTIEARIDVPSFDRSAMDGYAVIAEDTYSAGDLAPKTLKSIGSIYAGSIPTVEIGAGECVYIATGAMLPKGADSVVMVEYTEMYLGKVTISVLEPDHWNPVWNLLLHE
jgi:molybdopterin biosynthesis enzyme